MNEQGIVLPLVLLMVSLLIALVLGFDTEARRELKEASAFRDEVSASALNWSGLQAARAILLEDSRADLTTGRLFDGLTDTWALPSGPLSIGHGTITIMISDERSKLNINELALPRDAKLRAATMKRFKRLFSILGIDQQLVDAVADWLDPDDVQEKHGAERSYYESLHPPHRPPNEAIQNLDELRLVRGMTAANLERLRDYITVYPLLSDGWININTADPIVIQSLDERITPAMAVEIAQTRPYRNPKDVDRLSTVEPIAKELRLMRAYDVWSDYFAVRIQADAGGRIKQTQAIVQRSRTNGGSHVVAFEVR